jgi:hypothetical protein
MDYNLSTDFSIRQSVAPIYNSVSLSHASAAPVANSQRLAWALVPSVQLLSLMPWSLSVAISPLASFAYSLAGPAHLPTLCPYAGIPVALDQLAPYSPALPLASPWILAYNQAARLDLLAQSVQQLAARLDLSQFQQWSNAQALDLNAVVRWGVFPVLIDGVPVAIIPGALPNPDWRPNQSTMSVIVPIRSYYPVANSFSMVRLPERTPIECISLGLSIDTASWGWSVGAEVDQSAYDLLFPSPGQSVEIEILINGLYLFTAVVNKLPRKRAFAKNSFSLSASSRAVWLTEPFASVSQRLNTSAITAQQLAAEALLAAPFAGDIGFSLNWGLLDWLVPANAYSHTGSPMQYLSDIATAAGASIQAHRSDWQLSIAPLFPIPAWQWATATPDYIIPVDAIQTDSLEWDDLPNINGITLSGGAVGGIINVTRRAGTAGDKLLQPITHPLFTDVYATQQRATAELSKSGRRFKSVITMPVLPETGIIDTNKLIRITEGASSVTWMSRANSVSAKFGETMQSITLERYESVV